MGELQRVAVRLFEERGFDRVTVEDVAAEVGVSPSTVYRHVGTKEHLVLHDPQDAVITAELETTLATRPPAVAFRDAAVHALAQQEQVELFRRRVRLIFRTPSLWAAAVEQDHRDRAGLAAGFATARGAGVPDLSDEVTAAVCLTALDVALEHWQREEGSSLGDLIHAAFTAAFPGIGEHAPGNA